MPTNDKLDKEKEILLGNQYKNEHALGLEADIIPLPVIKTRIGGGEILFFNAKNGQIIITASSMNNLIFEAETELEPLGGIVACNFRFSYFGSALGIAGAKLLLKCAGDHIGYADLIDFKIENNILEGKGRSIFAEIGKIKPDYVFYEQNLTMHEAIIKYNDWVKKRAANDKVWYPIDEVVIADDVDNFAIDSIDTQGKSIKESFDMMVKMIGACYEVSLGRMMVYKKRVIVEQNAFDIDINETKDKIVNEIDLYTEEQGSELRDYVGNFSDNNSIALYGRKYEEIVIPFYIKAEPSNYAYKLMNPQSQFDGSFSYFAQNKAFFADYYVPYFEAEKILSACNSLANWTNVTLVEGTISPKAIKIDDNKEVIQYFTYYGAIDSVRIDFEGTFIIEFKDILGNSITSDTCDSSGLFAYKLFDIASFLNTIEFRGNGVIHGITGKTSQYGYKLVYTNKMSYTINGQVIKINISAADKMLATNIISDIKGNAALIDKYLRQ